MEWLIQTENIDFLMFALCTLAYVAVCYLIFDLIESEKGASKIMKWFTKAIDIWNWLTQKKIGRFVSLVLLGCIGWFFISGNIIVHTFDWSVLIFFCEKLGLESPVEITSLRALLLGLPVFIGLWYFRTHDTKEQIQKTQEQIEKAQESINVATLSNIYGLLASPELRIRCSGVRSLFELIKNSPIVSTYFYNVTRDAMLTSEERLNAPKDPTDEEREKINKSEIANFEGDVLMNLNLTGAKLQGANFKNTCLYNVNFGRAQLQHAVFSAIAPVDDTSNIISMTPGVNMNLNSKYYMNLNSKYYMNLNSKYYLSKEKIDRDSIFFHRLKLYGAVFVGADLSKTDFRGCCLIRANFIGAILSETDFRGADLRDAFFGKVKREDFLGCAFKGAYYDVHTKFLVGIEPRKLGMIEVDENGNPITKE